MISIAQLRRRSVAVATAAAIASTMTAVPSVAQEMTEGAPQVSILVGVGHDQSERRLSWQTSSTEPEVLQIVAGSVTEMPESARTITPVASGQSADAGRRYVHATVDGLSAGIYSYRVGSAAGGWSEIMQFEVFPATLNHRFTVVGDPQLGASGDLAGDSAGWQRALDAKDRLFPTSQFVYSMGDQVETYAGKVEEYREYLKPQQMRTQTHAQTLGNHDYARTQPQALYGQHFHQPNLWPEDPSRGNYYFFHNGVLHLNISTENRDWAAHRRFLEAVIAEHGAAAEWITLTFHRTIYSAGPHSQSGTTKGIREGLGPIVADLPIDVVFNGHDHTYGRSFVMENGAPLMDESVQFTGPEGHTVVRPRAGQAMFLTANSSSGSKYYALQPQEKVPWIAKMWQEGRQTIMSVDVSECSILSTTVTLDGSVVDKVEVQRPHKNVALAGPAKVQVKVGDTFDPYAQLEISDQCNVASNDHIVVSGADFSTAEEGTYTVTYQLAGRGGAQAQLQREVQVVKELSTDTSEAPGAAAEQPNPLAALLGGLLAVGAIAWLINMIATLLPSIGNLFNFRR